MLFNVEIDAGFLVKGYVVPDAYDKYCNLVLKSGGQEILVVAANGARDGRLVGGRHVDSQCGFYIDETHLSNLSQIADLELRDEETNILIYRRRKPEYISKKVFRLESHLFPLWRMDKPMNARFQYFATQVERYGRETILQIANLAAYDSVFFSGRIMYSPVRQYVEDVYKIVFVMHHPYEELAERLMVLRQIPEGGGGILASRDVSYFSPVLAFAKSLPLEDENALAANLRDPPREVAQLIASPIVRQLTCERMEDAPATRALSMALDVLSSFEIVGLRRASTPLLRAMAAFSQTSVNMLPPLSTLPGVTTLAKALRRSREFEHLLELDLQLYGYIAEAYRKVNQAASGKTSVALPEAADLTSDVVEQAAHV
jgi:hypothetical protein